MGTVGTGVYRVLTENASVISDKLGCEVVLKRIADHDIERDRGVTVPYGIFTTDSNDILNDPDISIVIELIGGTGVAKDIVISALNAGKHVSTANKALISTHGPEIFDAAVKNNVEIGFEASVGGGIPIIKALKEGLSANRIESIYGIINGTANYILTRMTNEGSNFADVLKDAQALGYAEADPTYDIEGIDTAHKLAILINIAYGTYVSHDDIYTEGITRITALDVAFAKELGYKLKLLAIAKSTDGEIEARVHPTMIPANHPLSAVEGVFNAIHIVGDAVGPVMFYGQGAGMMATASAVVADVVDIARNIVKHADIPVRTPLGCTDDAIKDVTIKSMDDIEAHYYMRFSAIDRPGVLSKITGVLGEHNISVSSVIQRERQEEEAVPLVVITHNAFEREVRAAVEEIEKLDVVVDKTMYIRIEAES